MRKRLSEFLLASSLITTAAANGVLFTNFYSFTGGTDGFIPTAPLMQASDGKLYGTTAYGGFHSSFNGYGTVFQTILSGTFTSLYQFENSWDGGRPDLSGLVEGPDGYFYGTTLIGGDYNGGVIFVMFPDGFLFPVYSFGQDFYDGDRPEAGVTLAADGNFYGTTSSGGINSFGSLFRLNADWEYTNLFSFNGTNGAAPYCSLVQASDGYLYGTTFRGGTAFNGRDGSGNATGHGVVFKISTNGTFTSLFSFSGTNGAQPVAGLIQGLDGSLYGVTEKGGANNYGTVFKISTNGVFTLLYSFTAGVNGAYPTGKLVQGPDGNLYGTTADIPYLGGPFVPIGNGTIFRITPSGLFTKLYSLAGQAGGVEPVAGMIHATDGNFYGTCLAGPYTSGMIFRFSVPFAPVLKSPQKTTNGFTFKWSSVAGLNYQAQVKTNLNSINWNDLGMPVVATNGVMSTVDGGASSANRFYRVVLLP